MGSIDFTCEASSARRGGGIRGGAVRGTREIRGAGAADGKEMKGFEQRIERCGRIEWG